MSWKGAAVSLAEKGGEDQVAPGVGQVSWRRRASVGCRAVVCAALRSAGPLPTVGLGGAGLGRGASEDHKGGAARHQRTLARSLALVLLPLALPGCSQPQGPGEAPDTVDLSARAGSKAHLDLDSGQGLSARPGVQGPSGRGATSQGSKH